MYDPGDHKTLAAVMAVSQYINVELRVLRQNPLPFISLLRSRPNLLGEWAPSKLPDNIFTPLPTSVGIYSGPIDLSTVYKIIE